MEFWIESLKKVNLKNNPLILFLQINKEEELRKRNSKFIQIGLKLINSNGYKRISIPKLYEKYLLQIRKILFQKRTFDHSKGIQINLF